jgi:hypothetical protein
MKEKMDNKIKCICLLALFLVFLGCKEDKVQESEKVAPFPLANVSLLEGPFEHATALNTKILLDYEPDRFLAKFRKGAGLGPKADNYQGWEAESLAGHSLGHYLSACSLRYAATADTVFLERVRYIVDELALCQEKDGDGYIGAFENGKKIFEEEIANGEIRSQGFDLNGLWAPYYVQHKILAGLRDAYRLTGNKRALEVATSFANWIHTVTSKLSEVQMQEVLYCEYGGMKEVLVDLYEDTDNEKYRAMAETFYDKAVLDDLVQQRDSLAGLHANTQIPKVIGLLKEYVSTGNEDKYRAATFFWDRVVNHHSYVTGGNANHEYFGRPDTLSRRLSDETTETCNVYNMLKLSDMLFQQDPRAEIADYYERALFNQILSSQHPVTGKVIYNLSLEMGGFKKYEDPFDFTCCVGTGMENHSKYNGHIYYHNEKELFVTQFMASELNWKEKGIKLQQRTDFPREQGTALQFTTDRPQQLKVQVRYPKWAIKGMDITVNGELVPHEQEPGSFVAVDRVWENGDVVKVNFPFSLQVEPMPDDSNRVAFMYGPLVLAGELGEVDDAAAKEANFVPVLFSENNDPSVWLQKAGAPNSFMTKGVGSPRDVVMHPFYTTHDKRYSVYWDMFTQEEWHAQQQAFETEKAAYALLEKNTYDFVQPGEMQPERNHKFQGEGAVVVEMKGRKARQAERGGWFSFEVEVLPEGLTSLVFEYWGGYTGKKIFDILVDDERIATQDINGIKDGAFLTKEYPVPAALTNGKKKITVRIQPHTGSRGGPVFGIRTVRTKTELKR